MSVSEETHIVCLTKRIGTQGPQGPKEITKSDGPWFALVSFWVDPHLYFTRFGLMLSRVKKMI